MLAHDLVEYDEVDGRAVRVQLEVVVVQYGQLDPLHHANRYHLITVSTTTTQKGQKKMHKRIGEK